MLENYFIFNLKNITTESEVINKKMACNHFTFEQINDSTDVIDISLMGSIDGNTWFELVKSTNIGTEVVHVINKPVQKIKVVVNNLGNGTKVDVNILAVYNI